MDIEIAVQDAAGARIAKNCGADRVELCTALETGGLTPTLGTLESVLAVGIPVHVLIRPRPGGFIYDSDEFALMYRDAQLSLKAGADGLVIGALGADNRVDIAGLTQISELALGHGAHLTLHRCADVALVAAESLSRLLSRAETLGCQRILTSGGAPTVCQGLEVLAELQQLWGDKGTIQPGGGVKINDIPTLREAGFRAVHLSARRLTQNGASGPGGASAEYGVTSEEVVRQAVEAAKGIQPHESHGGC